MKMSLPLLILALAACSPERGPTHLVETRPNAEDAARGDALMQRVMTTMHNVTRQSARVAPLTWSASLAVDAQRYAEQLTRTRRFEHSPQPRGIPNQGENLWTGTRGAYRYEEMAQHWVDEERFFVNLPVPAMSNTGNYEDVGHYTQIIWSRTTAFGCGFASNRTDDYLVCRYTPGGNVVGERTLP